jgi:hypothetical protein
MQTGSWTRPTWFPSGGTTQAFQSIEENVRLGTLYAGSVWKMTSSGTITIDTTSQTWTQQVQQATNLTGGALGSFPYQSGNGATAMLAGNSAATDQVPTSTGTGSATQAPTLKNAPALSAANMTNFPSSIVGTWLQLGGNGVGTAVTVGSNATHVNMFEIVIPSAVTTGHIEVDVTTADNSANTYDFCLYSGSPSSTINLLAHTGALAGSSINSGGTGYTNLAWASSTTLAPGRYYLVLFGNEASPTLQIGGSTLMSFYHNSSQSMTPASGACGSTMSSSADNPGQPTIPFFTLN